MIDLNKIRSVKVLEDIKRDLNSFLSNPQVPTVYVTELDWSEDDYEADKEMVLELLEKVEHRINSLSRFLKGKSKQPDSQPSVPPEPSASPDAP